MEPPHRAKGEKVSEHTKEPWTDEMFFWDIPDKNDPKYERPRRDWERLKACVNALAGIPDPAAFLQAADGLREYVAEMPCICESMKPGNVCHRCTIIAAYDAATKGDAR